LDAWVEFDGADFCALVVVPVRGGFDGPGELARWGDREEAVAGCLGVAGVFDFHAVAAAGGDVEGPGDEVVGAAPPAEVVVLWLNDDGRPIDFARRRGEDEGTIVAGGDTLRGVAGERLAGW
jgi:hypothetical protein